MKFCSHCGAQIDDEAVICVHCGCPVSSVPVKTEPKKDDTLDTVIKVLLVLGCIGLGWMIIPLVWCLPITISIFKKMKNGEPIGTGCKIAALLLVNTIAGICLLCRNEENY